MGTVYRAVDRSTGATVALKVMTRIGQNAERFAREARVLAELSHPAIVRYLAHGTTAEGIPFLAMEWLEGEDLANRLARTGLSVAESVTVVLRVAEAMAEAHGRGIVHRDVKPSNVFLVAGEPERAKLLDFGIARVQLSPYGPTARPITGTGMVLGTVGYMSPEQALADGPVDARTDVFALGCLLFECLTGQPAFSGAHVVAVLAKVLGEEAPRVRSLRLDLPAVLDNLVARMLCKNKEGRPVNGGALLRELDALGIVTGGVPGAGARPAPGISAGEQRLVSVLLAVVPDEPGRVGAVASRHGGEHARLANGAVIVTMMGRTNTSEQVVAAAACALELHEAFPSARLALATGRAQTVAGGLPGPVIDRAAALLAQSNASGIRIDEVTCGLLGERFEVRSEQDEGSVLLGRRSGAEAPRTLLGKPTPFVGRGKELGLLEATLRECLEESVARAVLVTGPAGQGKSRLRHEFLGRARESGDVSILTARAEPVGAGSSFQLVRQLVRQAAGLREGDPVPEQQERLRAHVAAVCSGGDAPRIADFLGELIGVPSSDRPSPLLRSTRNDSQLMGYWVARSFGEWFTAECTQRPLLIVLEDLHWGDLPSVSYLGDALRSLAARPFMLLALARPEVRETIPNLWTLAELLEVPLGRLTPRAAELLVRAALGADIAADRVADIVAKADGNAFYLEELIRRVSEGDDALPATILALVQSRLERLEPEARRVVRAASVFGEVFWHGGVAHLLGAGTDLEAWLQMLARREVITRMPDSRFPYDAEYRFRHGLLREAAYAMLTDDDRRAGHRLAAHWLEGVGEKDAVTLADHFEKGEEKKHAIPWLLQATLAALGGGNVDAVATLGERAIACEPSAIERGHFRQLQGSALLLRGDPRGSVPMSREAMNLLPAGSTTWFVSAATAFAAGMFLGEPAVTGPVCQAILTVPIQPEPSGPYGLAVYWTTISLHVVGQFEVAVSYLRRHMALGTEAPDCDPVFVQLLRLVSAYLDTANGELGGALESLTEAKSLGDKTGDAWATGGTLLFLVHALSQTGHYDRTETALRELSAFCGRRNLGIHTAYGSFWAASAKIFAGDFSKAIALMSPFLQANDPHLAVSARAMIAFALACQGEHSAARREADIVLSYGSAFPIASAGAYGVLAAIEISGGRWGEALSFAERGLELDARSPWLSNGSVLRLLRAEALHALGRTDEARLAIQEARDRIGRIADTLKGEPELRESYLSRVVVHARTLSLATAWLTETAVASK
jgi:hypothetical protein